MKFLKLKHFVVSLTVVGMLSSCVSNKKFSLLQKEDVNAKANQFPSDSTLRTYPRVDFEYHVQPEDILSVRVQSLTTKDFDFFNQAQTQNGNVNLNTGSGLLLGDIVDRNGEIPFHFLGKVKVSGMTIFEIQDKLQKIAAQYLESPIVRVRLLNLRFTMLGEVTREGTTVLFNNRATLLEAIGFGGGLTDLADKAHVKLIRQKGTATEVQYIDLLSEDFLKSPYYYVYQNDVLVVPPLRQRPFRKYVGQNLALVVSALSLLILSINLIQTNK